MVERDILYFCIYFFCISNNYFFFYDGDRISKLGRMGHTIKLVEDATAKQFAIVYNINIERIKYSA
jgi:hypothetical protein